MIRIFSSITLLVFSYCALSQNVGIGTNSPQAKLDINGNFRAGGLNNFLLYDSGKFTWNNSYIWAPTPMYLMMHSAAAEGLHYAGSQLEYLNSTGNPVFFTNWSNGNGYFSGNLGIGLSSPSAKLHVGSGTVRIEGPSSSGGNALSIGGYGDFEVDAFGSAGGRFIVKEDGNTGIGNPSAPFPLSFANSLGDKISLWGNSGAHYGLGIQSTLLQIHTDSPGSDIAFGYGSSNLFTESMRIKGSGKVGIGVIDPQQTLSMKGGMNIDQTNLNNGGIDNNVLRFGSNSGEAIGSGRIGGSDNLYGLDFYTGSGKRMVITNGGNVGIGTASPAFKLDIADRMRIRSGGGFSSAGLYLNNNNNTASPAFIGMHDDNHVGFWGSTVGWGLTMNTDNGALKVNGNEGSNKQVLTSSGSGNGSSWKTMGSLIQTYYNYPAYLSNSEGTLTSGNTVVFTALTSTITVSTKSRLIISASVSAYNGFCVGCGSGNALLDIRVNGTEAGPGIYSGVSGIAAVNGSDGFGTISNYFYDVNPGTYTIEFIAQTLIGHELALYSKYSTIMVLPVD
jgi:hypothetical protein